MDLVTRGGGAGGAVEGGQALQGGLVAGLGRSAFLQRVAGFRRALQLLVGRRLRHVDAGRIGIVVAQRLVEVGQREEILPLIAQQRAAAVIGVAELGIEEQRRGVVLHGQRIARSSRW